MAPSSDTRPSRRPATLGDLRPLVALAALLLAPLAAAQGVPTWIVVPDGSGAYVEAFTYPASMTQEETAIFVVCDPDAPSGLNVRLWIGANPAPPEEAEGLVRLGQGEVQRYPWFVGGENGDRATPKFFSDLDAFLADLRTGGTMAIRLLLLPGVPDANQPTFQYEVSGFAAAERQLACGAAGAPASAPDPFAAPAAPDPFAAGPAPQAPATAAPSPSSPSPRSRAAAPPAAPAAPPAAPMPLPPSQMPPTPSQMAPPSQTAPPPPSASTTTTPWYLFPNGLEVAFDGADRVFGFACLDGGEVAAYLRLPGVAIATDAENLTTFTFEYEHVGSFSEPDEWVFIDLGDGLYATDTTASYMIAFTLEVAAGVRVGHGGAALLEAPGGGGFAALTQQMPCLLEEE